MDDQFDKNLSNHIRGVFDNYEHPGNADAGWAALRTKFPVRQARKPALLWWAGVAAILLLCFGIGLWAINKDEPAIKLAQQTKPVKQRPKDKSPAVITADKPAVVVDNGNLNKTATNTIVTNKDPLNSNKYYNDHSVDYVHVATVMPGNNDATLPTKAVKTPVDQQPNQGLTALTIAPVVKPDSAAISSNNNNPQIAAVTDASVNKAQSVVKQQPAKTIIDLFEQDKLNTPATKKETRVKVDKKVAFSVYAATYFNYAEGSANQINAGAGFTSDIKLSRKIKLSTGVALAQNTLRYNSSLPPEQAGRSAGFAAAASPTIKQSDLFSVASEVPVFKNYNASLIGLDIPINIKYEFDPEKSDTYVSAGLSSGTFIDEKYTYSYTYSNNRTATAQNATTTNSFNSFYFGKTLNVSFGVGYPLGKSNRLIIEPFLKYPLDGLGAQQLRFGAGGLNLKINFKGKK